MNSADLFASSSSEIPLADLLEARAQAQRDHLTRRLRAIRGTVPQRAKAAARVLAEGLPAEIACIFLALPGELVFAGGCERHPGTDVALWRQPASATRQRLMRLAEQAQAHATTLPHQIRAARAGAAWRAHAIQPIADATGTTIGWLVMGRRTLDFIPDDLVTLAELSRPLAIVLAAAVDPPSDPASLPPAAMQAIFGATDDAALLLAPDFTMQALNPAWQTLTGWNVPILGQPCLDVLRCHDDQGIPFCGTVQCPLFAARPPGSSQPIPRLPARIGGTGHAERAVRLGAVALENGYLLLVRADPSPQAMEEQRDRFLSDLAHKLRNRFNSINGFVELVAMDQQHPITASQRMMLSMAHNSSLELLEYIENLLYLTRRDVGDAPLLLDAIAPSDLLEEVEQHLAIEAAAVPVQLVRHAPEDLPLLRCDRTRLRQAIMNLVTNAIKFTPPQGTVTLAAQATDDAMILTVADTGLGIAPEDQPHVFERDYIAERTARLGKNGGGMGMAAARAIVEQHGGTLTFLSQVEHGTTFIIRLPR
jgi:signal transduction histidine kinase